MPVYEYACTSCGERTEAKQSFHDPPLEECPQCGGRLRKLYSPVGIVFRGSGFYSTDARKKPAPAGSKDDSASTKDVKKDTNKEVSKDTSKGSSTKEKSA